MPHYVVKKQLTFSGNQKFPGDLCPEASGWGNLKQCIADGLIEVLDESPSAKVSEAKGEEAPPEPKRFGRPKKAE